MVEAPFNTSKVLATILYWKEVNPKLYVERGLSKMDERIGFAQRMGAEFTEYIPVVYYSFEELDQWWAWTQGLRWQ